MEPNQFESTISRSGARDIDAGLKAHFQKVYNIMALGLAITGFAAYGVAQIPGIEQIFATIASNMILMLAFAASPMIAAMVLFNGNALMRGSFQSLVMRFAVFSAIWGAMLSVVFLVYSPESIIKTFFITSATFAATSIIGYTTKMDLSKMGAFLSMAVIGLMIAIAVNIFLQSPMMHILISGAGVVIYTGLIAWDTQKIKETYSYAHGDEANGKMAVISAIGLYQNFIMLFQFLLQFLGNRE